ncbi:hypothetical protein [Qipengyuania sp. ASV99]|uniref:hypothetical protein n=1 Tax=Qipengyuania sp. ASV99 TaxID=3399681 RepID=UPI003A4C65CF
MKSLEGREIPSAVAHPRLLTLLSDGADHLAARLGLERGWDLAIPLPFGRALNTAINARPAKARDAKAILRGEEIVDPATRARIEAIKGLTARGKVFELADNDERLSNLFCTALEAPEDKAAASAFAAEIGRRAEIAGRILIEQSDLIVAIWDGQSTAIVGGTGHTALAALKAGVPVLWINPAVPQNWAVHHSPEALASPTFETDANVQASALAKVVSQAVSPLRPGNKPTETGLAGLGRERWRGHSLLLGHAFRRVEALFGEATWAKRLASVRQRYEAPNAIGEGSAKGLLEAVRSMSAGDDRTVGSIDAQILTRFAWLNGISSNLSDRHRSGMTVNFILGACAIISGILYLPLVSTDQKWIFAGCELLFLLAILINTAAGRKMRLHDRWFETRRAAEYLRHSSMLAVMGVSRPNGAWPHGTNSWWPEWYVKHSVRAVGLPEARIDKAYLRAALETLRDQHVVPQRTYHRAKFLRLNRAHHGLDVLSERLFVSAVVFVGLYLFMAGFSAIGLVDPDWLKFAAKWFTVLAVALPTLGSALAGIRYFGDFERFAEISQVTAEKLDVIATRIDAILSAPGNAMTYDAATEIVRATDDAVFAEIQNWQSVFSGKVIAVPA